MTALFLSECDLRYTGIEPKPWTLIAPLRYQTAEHNGVWTVPAGFKTDLASVPQFLWRLFPRDGPYLRAAVMHDGAYEGAIVTDSGQKVRLIKPIADALFREASQAPPNGVSAATAWILYQSVSAFGRKEQNP